MDLGLGDASGFEVMEHLRRRNPELPTIVVTAQRDVESAVAAMRAGAYDYLTKPVDRDRLLLSVKRACERRALVARVERLQNELSERKVLGSIVGTSPSMRELARQVERVLESDVAVCLFGESGTGKELVARAIHSGGPRHHGPFRSDQLRRHPGLLAGVGALRPRARRLHRRHPDTARLLRSARRAALLLDEIGEMSLSTQASLLRTLQEKNRAAGRRVAGDPGRRAHRVRDAP